MCVRRWILINDGLQRDRRFCDLIGGRVGDRGRGLFEYEQPSARDLPRERLAVADREEPVTPTVRHERRYREVGQILAPARRAVQLGTKSPMRGFDLLLLRI